MSARSKSRLSRRKKALFALITLVLFFGVLELVLWIFRVDRLVDERDPSWGFSGLVDAFERDGEHFRTRENLRTKVFNDQSFAAAKPDDGLRIFVLGGSSAYGFPWDAETSFSGILQAVLQESHPDRKIEVVNAAGISYAMHRLRILAEELVEYDPDIFIIYSGHNEFVERDAFHQLKAQSEVQQIASNVLARSRAYSLIHHAVRGRQAEEDFKQHQLGMTVDRDQSKIYAIAETGAIVADFRDGLQQLIETARGHGVRVLVSTVPCNLRGWKPEASRNDVRDAAQRQRWSQALHSGAAELSGTKNYAKAITALEAAIKIDPQHAESHYLLGQALEGAGEWQRAVAEFQRACDFDASPIRRKSGINAAARAIASESNDVLLLDADKLFESESEHGLVGFNLIEDYVHPNVRGHKIIAWKMWIALEESGWLGAKSQPARANFDRIVSARSNPDDRRNPIWFFNQGVVLQNRGYKEQAAKAYREALAVNPDYHGAANNLAQLLFRDLGAPDEAGQIVIGLLKKVPDHHLARILHGEILSKKGEVDKAIAAWQFALEAEPNAAAAHNLIGTALAQRKDFDGAITHLEKAVSLNPNQSNYRLNLGNLFLMQDQLERAEQHFVKALNLDPNNAIAHCNLGVLLERRGQLEGARAKYETALRLNPNFGFARKQLEALQQQ